jgi:hypothetical protein
VLATGHPARTSVAIAESIALSMGGAESAPLSSIGASMGTSIATLSRTTSRFSDPSPLAASLWASMAMVLLLSLHPTTERSNESIIAASTAEFILVPPSIGEFCHGCGVNAWLLHRGLCSTTHVT